MFGDRYFGKHYFGNRYFGPGANASPALHPPGGDPGYYRRRRPTIYLDRDGKPVDIHARQPEPAFESEVLPELTPAMLEALMAQVQIAQPAPVDPMASIMAKMGQLVIQRELDAMADDDTVLVLLLA